METLLSLKSKFSLGGSIVGGEESNFLALLDPEEDDDRNAVV